MPDFEHSPVPEEPSLEYGDFERLYEALNHQGLTRILTDPEGTGEMTVTYTFLVGENAEYVTQTQDPAVDVVRYVYTHQGSSAVWFDVTVRTFNDATDQQLVQEYRLAGLHSSRRTRIARRLPKIMPISKREGDSFSFHTFSKDWPEDESGYSETSEVLREVEIDIQQTTEDDVALFRRLVDVL